MFALQTTTAIGRLVPPSYQIRGPWFSGYMPFPLLQPGKLSSNFTYKLLSVVPQLKHLEGRPLKITPLNHISNVRGIHTIAHQVGFHTAGRDPLSSKTKLYKRPEVTYVCKRDISAEALQTPTRKIHYFTGPGPKPLWEAIKKARSLSYGAEEEIHYVTNEHISPIYEAAICLAEKYLPSFFYKKGAANDLVFDSTTLRPFIVYERDQEGSIRTVRVETFYSSNIPSEKYENTKRVSWVNAEESAPALTLEELAKEIGISDTSSEK